MNCIVTRADDSVRHMSALTHPILEVCAEEWDADFIVLDQDAPMSPHYRILGCKEMFEAYDRILCIDTDVIVRPGTPNPFELIDAECIGCVFEDVGTRQANRRARMQSAQFRFGNIGWEHGYPNTGFIMMSKCHADAGLLDEIDGRLWNGLGYDDVHLGYQMKRLNLPVVDLPYIWNHMTMFSEKWNGKPSRFDSYIIHYAGQGIFNKRQCRTRMQQIRKDYEQLYGKK